MFMFKQILIKPALEKLKGERESFEVYFLLATERSRDEGEYFHQLVRRGEDGYYTAASPLPHSRDSAEGEEYLKFCIKGLSTAGSYKNGCKIYTRDVLPQLLDRINLEGDLKKMMAEKKVSSDTIARIEDLLMFNSWLRKIREIAEKQAELNAIKAEVPQAFLELAQKRFPELN